MRLFKIPLSKALGFISDRCLDKAERREHRGNPLEDSYEELKKQLNDEVAELFEAVEKIKGPEVKGYSVDLKADIVSETADVINQAIFIMLKALDFEGIERR